MPILVMVPTQIELDAFHSVFPGPFEDNGAPYRTTVRRFPSIPIASALGGLGKAQSAVQAQHLIDASQWSLVICLGAAGALDPGIRYGAIVVGTETVEHDIRKTGRPLMPRFPSSTEAVALCRAVSANLGFPVHFGPIASGDEDIVGAERAAALRRVTGALAVAWEGAGVARACAFSQVPFLEVRGIADLANESGPTDFRMHLDQAVRNAGALVLLMARRMAA